MKREFILKKRIVIVFTTISLIILAVAIKPIFLLWEANKNDGGLIPLLPANYADDVSRLNKTRIDSSVNISSDSSTAVAQLVSLIIYASEKKVPVSIAGAKHSMGGHTIAPDGIRINMLPFNKLSIDTLTEILTVGSGALWSDVIPYLNKYGRAVAIMQSDNAFSVGGSISVNCHGWQHNKAPISSSVLSFNILTAKGEIIHCDRSQNKELFSLALGGYGLFGIILDVQLKTVKNEIYTYHRILMSSDKYLEYYKENIDDKPKARMVYGRLNINKKDFLQKAMLNYFEFERTARKDEPLTDPEFLEFKRSIFLSSKDDDYGKRMRWNSERVFSKTLIGSAFSRNQIMNESPSVYLNKSASHTDVLHEYFIPRRNFNLFINKLQDIIPEHEVDLLNVTIRNVYKDEDTFLNYSREEMFAFVMFFNQALSDKSEKELIAVTKKLIDAAIGLDGTYYLPYRLHASKEQMQKGYPNIGKFMKKKLEYDSLEVFQNKFYLQYRDVEKE